MAYRPMKYQYETSPRKLKPEYEPIKNDDVKKKSSTLKQKNKKSQKQAKLEVKTIMYIVIGFAILFAISYRNSLITASFNQKESLKKQFSTLQKENAQTEINIQTNLNLTNIEAICTRAEEFSRINEEKYDLVTARAVASLSILLECSIRLVKIGKFFVAMKGNQIEYFNNEKELKIKKVSEIDFELPFERSERKLLKFEKISSTPKKYPRAYSVIKKKPL